jgi:hypothetical protein
MANFVKNAPIPFAEAQPSSTLPGLYLSGHCSRRDHKALSSDLDVLSQKGRQRRQLIFAPTSNARSSDEISETGVLFKDHL